MTPPTGASVNSAGELKYPHIATPYYSRIAGTGSYLPEKILTNADLEKMVDTNDQWIVERTGIRERHIAAPDQITSDLAFFAATRALEAANLSAKDLDLIIFATVSGDQIMPSSSAILQKKLGARQIMAFDLSAACSGFVYGCTVADQFIRTGMFKNVLVIGAEILTRVTDFKDRETCILFGDGAGAVILSRTEDRDGSRLLSGHLRADGALGDLFSLDVGGSALPFSQDVLDNRRQFMRMKGRELFKQAVRTMSQVCQEALDANGLLMKDVNWLIPHQANIRIIHAVGNHFGIEPEKVIINVDRTGNTSAATVPIAFDEAVRDGRIKRGETVLLTAFGAGMTSGSLLMRY